MTTKAKRRSAKLPPDPEGANEERAATAKKAVAAFRKASGTDMCDAVADLLCDLMHLCDRDHRLGNFDDELHRAWSFYEEETEDV